MILVLGIHRSLSSCVAEVLERLGVYMGDTRGGEDRLFARWFERHMPFPSTEIQGKRCARLQELRDLFREYLFAEAPKSPNPEIPKSPVGLKYPHACAFAGEIAQAWPDLKIVSLDRPIQDSIESLVDRSEQARLTGRAIVRPFGGLVTIKYGASPEECERLQRFLDEKRRQFLKGRQHLAIDVHELLDLPAEVIDRIIQYLGLSSTPDQRAAAIAHVQPTKAVHRRSRQKAVGSRQKLEADVQILIKSFRRFDCLRRCVESIRRFYPEVEILVADDSFEGFGIEGFRDFEYPEDAAVVRSTPGVTWIQLPFDTGLAAGRNALVEAATADYVVILDDDMVITHETDLAKLAAVLDEDPRVDVLSGCVRFDRSTPQHLNANFYPQKTRDGRKSYVMLPPHSPWQLMGGVRYRPVEMTNNCFLARRSALLRCLWDPRMKISFEHPDWALDCVKKAIGVCYTPDVIFGHQRRNNPDYLRYRLRRDELPLFLEKYGLERRPLFFVERDLQAEEPPTIPRRLHQIWVGSERMPPEQTAWCERVRRLHPRWHYRLWGNEAYRILPDVLRELWHQAGGPAQQADLLRYWLLYRFGGIYLDTDVEVLRPLDSLIDCPAFVSKAAETGHCSNGILGSIPYHPFLADVLRRLHVRFSPMVRNSIGPPLVTEVVRQRGDVRIYEQEVFLPVEYRDWKNLGPRPTERTVAVHHFAASWVGSTDRTQRGRA